MVLIFCNCVIPNYPTIILEFILCSCISCASFQRSCIRLYVDKHVAVNLYFLTIYSLVSVINNYSLLISFKVSMSTGSTILRECQFEVFVRHRIANFSMEPISRLNCPITQKIFPFIVGFTCEFKISKIFNFFAKKARRGNTIDRP